MTATRTRQAKPKVVSKTQLAMEAAARLAVDGKVSFNAVQKAAGYNRTQLCEMVSRKTKEGRWHWTDSDPVPDLQNKTEVPGERERIRQEWTALMLPPESQIQSDPKTISAAEACRSYLREWRQIKRRWARAEAKIEVGEVYQNAQTPNGWLGVTLEYHHKTGAVQWRGKYYVGEESIYGPAFETAEDAARWYDKTAMLRGETVRLNSNPDPAAKKKTWSRHPLKRGTSSHPKSGLSSRMAAQSSGIRSRRADAAGKLSLS